MSFTIGLLVLALLLVGSAVFAGSETGFYSLSRVRVEIRAREGHRIARLVRWLQRDDTALLITILIGNNLAAQLATYQAEDLIGRFVPPVAIEVVVTLCLSPLLFLFGEVFPKDLFRRRPHALIGVTAPFIALCRVLFWPVERLLWLVTTLLSRVLGRGARLGSQVRGREAVLRLLEEGAQTGAIERSAEALARNVLKLRTTRVSDCMIPWEDVRTLDASASVSEQHRTVTESLHTRLPVVGTEGAIEGYVHQLDVLGAGRSDQAPGPVRRALAIEADTSVDRALARLRADGQRMAILGSLKAPVGLVTLKDLLEEISGDLADW